MRACGPRRRSLFIFVFFLICCASSGCQSEAPGPSAAPAASSPTAAAPAPSAPQQAATTGEPASTGGAPTVLGPDDPRVRAAREALEAQEQASQGPRVPLDQPLTPEDLRTTSCAIFLGNLEGQVRSRTRQAAQRPDDPSVTLGLADAKLRLAQLNGSLEGLAEVIDLLDAAIEAHPEAHALRLERARAAMSLHRFALARADLDHLTRAAPDLEGLAPLRDELDLHTGRDLPALLARMVTAYQGDASWRGYVTAAQARWMRGEYALADRYYGMGARRYEGVAPIPLSWLQVQRGLMAMHTGQFERARDFFVAAHARCPQYPMAAEHLAEILGRLGEHARAIALYREVIERTDNPEFMAALADVLEASGAAEEAAAMRARADARFRELEARFPEAASGHAADFYLGAGDDAAFALTLLTRDFAARPTPQVAEALASAHLAVGDLEAAQRAIDLALEGPVEFAEKHWTASRIARAAGDDAAADAHAERARALNPRIEEM